MFGVILEIHPSEWGVRRSVSQYNGTPARGLKVETSRFWIRPPQALLYITGEQQSAERNIKPPTATSRGPQSEFNWTFKIGQNRRCCSLTIHNHITHFLYKKIMRTRFVYSKAKQTNHTSNGAITWEGVKYSLWIRIKTHLNRKSRWGRWHFRLRHAVPIYVGAWETSLVLNLEIYQGSLIKVNTQQRVIWLLISSLISLKLPQFSYLCLRNTYRGIHEEYFSRNALCYFKVQIITWNVKLRRFWKLTNYFEKNWNLKIWKHWNLQDFFNRLSSKSWRYS